MKLNYILLFLINVTISISVKGQTKEADLYKAAYDYLNDSIVKSKFVDAKTLAKNCSYRSITIKANGKQVNTKFKFNSELQVAYEFNDHRRGFPIENFIKSKLTLSKDCLTALRMNTRTCDEVNYLSDSLETFWQDYEMKSYEKIKESLKNLPSKRKDGFQVFFSDIYKNTLSAEIDGFCAPYDKVKRVGAPLFFFFVFNDQGEIIEVYSGKTMHYN
ncbi:hypothetical protein [Aureibacter tunicatorum]|uniref:Uncharacterized protein n=1 Tax=Aureibacter tunicatorum TaxID=866807 RepID=A0AAE3XKC8_9BACT|nr:hypothetical protein [Aureibacter tunicatorum]MDR6238487.1 hypothetical protein [Aureibacter tunicatorum]BDD05580.1 hypothetical protein AUTU_30630 [Aureibacter tunicatorum]